VTARFGFIDGLRALEEQLRGELQLSARTLPRELERLSGTFREKPATLTARAYSGPSCRYARFVELESEELEIANLVILPEADTSLPILGVDLVGVGRDTAVAVADLSPVTPDTSVRHAQLECLERHHTSRLPPETRLELPGWALEWFSRGALSARIGLALAETTRRAVGEFADAFVELARGAGASPNDVESVASRHAAYCRSHRDQDRGLLLLRRIFEPLVADRFLREVLFPERIPA